MAIKDYFRVFEPAWGGVLNFHPDPPGRFSLKTDMPRTVKGAGGWYVSDTQSGALWESVLRNLAPDINGGVYIDRAVLAKYSIQRVRRLVPGLILRTERPKRSHIVDPYDLRLQAHWDHYSNTEVYEETHTAAGLVQLQCAALTPPMILTGISWMSHQSGQDVVYILYSPPLTAAEWAQLGTAVSLDSDHGHDLVRAALAAADMTWLDDPTLSGGTPPAGAV